MDLIVDLIDQLIEIRVEQLRVGVGWTDYKHEIAVLKERLRRVLLENIPNK